ncbi:N-alpha-acetyltransferase 40 [Anabrus simplex]|uniref:N-alpha-acetyltransferase 40 n=1 Tax=Anabrus simplex TaxID=316456 RepID=UPI0035A32891
MGRKSTKGKEKRLQRKEENLLLAAAQKVVDEANAQEDPLASFPAFRKFEKNGISVVLDCKRVTELDQNTINWIFETEKKHMKELYEKCSWGWNDKTKLEEMTDSAAWYLLARTTQGQNVAFSHFRFDLDYGTEVLYCYEIQLEECVRRKGLGKFMLQLLELIGFTARMKKIVLTVLKHNPGAVAFFRALKYELDETSPVDTLYEDYPYEILCKPNKKLFDKA